MEMQPDKCILLVGNPNAGKTMLFNRLTGLSARVANYPGITVEFRRGQIDLARAKRIQIVDLPGTYSLHPRSEDEEIAVKGVLGQLRDVGNSHLIVAVVDATQLKRNLYLVSQLLELRKPFVVALTMMDMARKKGIDINAELLSRKLSVPVVALSSLTGEGIDKLKETIDEALPLTPTESLAQQKSQCNSTEISKRYQQIDAWLSDTYQTRAPSPKPSFNLDSLLLHRVMGPVFLVAIFALMFETLFSWSKPIIDLIESAVRLVSGSLRLLFPTGSLFGSLIADGVVAGVGSVIAFVPLIALLFLFIGLLEDSGYLARATFLLDRLMSKVGLPGRAFVPLLSGFACAVPAILATRVIESRKDRLITILVTPLMACSARLPIYGLLIATAFSSMPPVFGFIQAGTMIMISMYSLGILAAFCTAAVLKRFVFKGPVPALILELPPYRMPRWKPLAQNVLARVRVFLREAGTIILAMTVVLWALFTFPRVNQLGADSQVQMQQSYAGQLGHIIEPVIEPLGFDWKIGIGLLASFAAREVLVSTLGVIYGLGDSQNETSTSLRQAIQNDTNPQTGKPVYTPLVALSLMVFFSLAMQCMSTLAATRKETGSWRWPVVQFGYMSVLAWVCSFSLFQVGSALGF